MITTFNNAKLVHVQLNNSTKWVFNNHALHGH